MNYYNNLIYYVIWEEKSLSMICFIYDVSIRL